MWQDFNEWWQSPKFYLQDLQDHSFSLPCINFHWGKKKKPAMGLTCSQLGFQQLGFQSVPGLRWPELPMCYQTSSPEFFPARLFAVSGEGIPSKKVSLVVTTEDMPHHLPFSHFKLVETKSSQDEKRLLSTRVRNKKDSADIYPVLLITDKKKKSNHGTDVNFW